MRQDVDVIARLFIRVQAVEDHRGVPDQERRRFASKEPCMLIQIIRDHARMRDPIVVAREQNVKFAALRGTYIQIRRDAQGIGLHAQQDLHLREFRLCRRDVRTHLRDLLHFDPVSQMARSVIGNGDRTDPLRRRRADIVQDRSLAVRIDRMRMMIVGHPVHSDDIFVFFHFAVLSFSVFAVSDLLCACLCACGRDQPMMRTSGSSITPKRS